MAFRGCPSRSGDKLPMAPAAAAGGDGWSPAVLALRSVAVGRLPRSSVSESDLHGPAIHACCAGVLLLRGLGWISPGRELGLTWLLFSLRASNTACRSVAALGPFNMGCLYLKKITWAV